ncbi:L-serine dehydratase/L-threonine deaminase-like [Ptychodera flava]|uniref:L-serine dehydratase/L-threonine deaminase-like n=1 Tax=Ptychodera flava TaxID=63121 RepID=UPI00396A111F
MGSTQDDDVQLHVHTPLIHSRPLSVLTGLTVNLKCENVQPTDTFKIRGVGNLCKKAKANGCKHIVCASGGNAGVAAAYAAQKLGIPCTIIIPESTPKFTAERLRKELGANVEIHGQVWNHAHERGLELAKQPGCTYVHPFDHPDVWEGHESMMVEVQQDLKEKPDVVITSVGGGGLLNGVVQGLQRVGWNDIPVIAMETVGADSYNQAVKAGHLVTLPTISSVAHCLGALRVCERSFENYSKHTIHSEVVKDKEAVSACLRFLDDHRIMVEPACGAALAGIYSNVIPKLQKEGKLKADLKNVVVIVCGGSSISIQQLMQWKEQFGL